MKPPHSLQDSWVAKSSGQLGRKVVRTAINRSQGCRRPNAATRRAQAAAVSNLVCIQNQTKIAVVLWARPPAGQARA